MNPDLQPALATLFKVLNRNTSLEELVSSLSPQDWVEIEAAARGQGLTLLTYDRLSRVNSLVPTAVQGRLRDAYLKATARNMVMLHHGGAVLNALCDRGLEVIVLKGLYLAEAVYTGIGLRTFGDVDLLLRRSDLSAALDVMRNLGYELSTWYDPDDPNRDIKHVPPLMKKGAPIVELHWTILEEDEPFAIGVEGMWARSVPAEIAGASVRGLSVEDLLLHLSLHLTYQHRLAIGVRNLYDIDAVIRRGGVDWTRLVTTAREWGAERVTWLTLRLLQEIAGTPLPCEVLERLLPVTPDLAIVEEARRQLLERGEGEVALTPDLAAFGEVRGIFGKLRLVIARVFIPRRVLGREYNVNPRSVRIYLYYFARFARLIRSYRGSAGRLLSGEERAKSSAQRERAKGELNRWLGGM
jgi:hypothetical protein